MNEMPWYERRPVLAGTIAAVLISVGILLATPFVDRTWPSKASAILATFWARVALQAIAYAGAFALGYITGRRSGRPPEPILPALPQPTAVPVLASIQKSTPLTLSDGTPSPTPIDIWRALDDEERRLIIYLWQNEDSFITDQQLEAHRRLHHLNAQRWNGMRLSLVETRKLISHDQWFSRGRNNQVGGLTWGWKLTDKGKNIAGAIEKRGELVPPPVAPGPWKAGDPY